VFDVVVWGAPETRTSLTSIRKLLIDTPAGGHVRLGQVADVRIAAEPGVIKREAVSRYVDVGVNVNGRDRSAVLDDLRGVVREMQFPLEYHAEVLTADTQPTGRLAAVGIFSAIGIFLLLQACFGSWRLATLAFLTMPLAVAGGVLAALAAGGEFSFGSYIALAAVFGLTARNGVMLIDRFRQLEREEGMSFGAELVLRGARDRLAPTVMTALATALAMLPLAILGGVPGQELLNPMAFVVLGGLVTSTLVSVLVIPSAYLRFGYVPVTEPSAEEAPDAVPALAD
jgi:Cu/Ag efflux pump CusA